MRLTYGHTLRAFPGLMTDVAVPSLGWSKQADGAKWSLGSYREFQLWPP